MAVTDGITVTQDPRQAGKFSKSDLSKARSLIQELYFYSRLHLHPTLPAPGRIPHTALCCDTPAISAST